MGPQSPAHQHPAPFLIRKFTGTAGVKKLVLGRHDPSQNGQTDGSAVKMARKGQIRPPGRGNYNIGLKEQIIFPEIEYDKIDKIRGMNISITTTAKTDEEAKALLAAFRFPFRN